MKISIIGTTTFPCPPQAYGGEIVIFDLASGLHELGHQVILHAVKNNDIDYPFQVNQLRDTHTFADWNAEFEALKYYENDILDSDVILDMSHGKTVSQELYYKQRRKNVCNYLIGNFWARPYPPFNTIVNSKKQLELGINGRTGFEGTLFQNDHEYTGKLPETSKFVYLGTNTNFYSPNYDKEDYFLWCARFHPWKGPMDAIKLAKDTGINLILTGDMDSNPEHIRHGKECLKLIEKHDNITYISLPQDSTHQHIKKELMQNAKAFLNPILFHESFGLTNIEALSCGTPVISNAMGALPEVIKHGETGFLCNNYEQMKNYVGLIDEINPKDCRKDVEERFSRQVMAKNYENILIELKDGFSW